MNNPLSSSTKPLYHKVQESTSKIDAKNIFVKGWENKKIPV
jgi:hypothetical protein